MCYYLPAQSFRYMPMLAITCAFADGPNKIGQIKHPCQAACFTTARVLDVKAELLSTFVLADLLLTVEIRGHLEFSAAYAFKFPQLP